MHDLVWVTGGTGLVGSNVVSALTQAGYSVLSPTHEQLDLLDATAVTQFLTTHHPDTVIHCAGRVGGIQANMAHPIEFLSENWLMGHHVVMGAHQAGIKRLINLGSSCMAPANLERPIRERDYLTGPLEPTNEGYALAKLSVMKLCQSLSQTEPHRQYHTLIPCNLYGPGDNYDPQRSHLMAALIDKLQKAVSHREPTVTIWGSGQVRRECLYAPDLAQCIVRALTHWDTLPHIMNVGPGEDHTINALYQTVAECLGYTGTFVHDTTQPDGIHQKCLDVTLQRQWGWQPTTSLRDGIRLTLASHSHHTLCPQAPKGR